MPIQIDIQSTIAQLTSNVEKATKILIDQYQRAKAQAEHNNFLYLNKQYGSDQDPIYKSNEKLIQMNNANIADIENYEKYLMDLLESAKRDSSVTSLHRVEGEVNSYLKDVKIFFNDKIKDAEARIKFLEGSIDEAKGKSSSQVNETELRNDISQIETQIKYYEGKLKEFGNMSKTVLGDVQGVTPVTVSQVDKLKHLGTVIGNYRNRIYKNRPVIGTDTSQAAKITQAFADAQQQVHTELEMLVNDAGKFVSPKNIRTPQLNKTNFSKKINNAIYYDLETLGAIGTDEIQTTQISMTSDKGTFNSFVRLNDATKKRLDEALKLLEDGKKLTADQQRELMSFANITTQRNGKNSQIIIGNKHQYDKDFVLSAISTDLISDIKKGIEILSDVSKGYTNYYETTQDAWNYVAKLAGANAKTVYAGHNIYGFDDRVLRKEGVQIQQELLDTLSIARQYLNLTSTNTIKDSNGNDKVVRLTGYGLDEFAEFFGIQINKAERHSAGYDTKLNREIAQKLSDYILSMGNAVKNNYGTTVQKGQIGKATTAYWKQDNSSFRQEKGKNGAYHIVAEKFGDWLLKAGEAYRYEGHKDIGNGVYSAKLTGITTQDEVFITGSLDQIQQAISHSFGDGFKAEDKIDARELAQNVIINLFKTGSKSFSNAQRIFGNNLSEAQYVKDNYSEGYALVQTAIKKITEKYKGNDTQSERMRQAAWESLGKSLGAIQETRANVIGLDKLITKGAVSQTFNGLKQSYINFIKQEFTGDINKEVREQLLEALNSAKLDKENPEARIKSGDINVPFYDVSAMILDELKAGNDRNGILNGLNRDSTLKLEDFKNQYNGNISDGIDEVINNAIKLVNPKDIVSEIASKNAYKAKVYTGAYAEDRLRKLGYQDEDTIKQFSSQNREGKEESLQNKLNQIIEAANAQGLTTEIGVTHDGDIKLGFYPTQDYHNVRNKKGELSWDDIATVTIGLADKEGTVNVNGIAKTNFGIMKADRNGQAYQITAVEQQAQEVLRIVKSDSFRNNLLNFGQPQQGTKALSWGVKKIFDGAATTFSGKVSTDTLEMSKKGSTEAQRQFRASAIKWEPYLQDILIYARNNDEKFRQDVEGVSDYKLLENMLQILAVMNSGADKNGTAEYSSIQQIIKNNEYIGKALKDIAEKVRISWYSTKEEQVTQGLMTHQLGSGDFEFAGWARDEASRATSQSYNAITDYQKTVINGVEKTLKSKVAKINNFAKGGLDSNSDERSTLTLGYVNDTLLAKARQLIADNPTEYGFSKQTTLKDIPLYSVAEGGMIIGQNVADQMIGYYTQKYEIENDDLNNELREMVEGLTDDHFIEKIVQSGSLYLGNINGQDRYAEVGDKIKVTRVGDTYQFDIGRKVGVETGTKFVGGGNRVSVNGIANDKLMRAYKKALTKATTIKDANGKVIQQGKDYSDAQAFIEDTGVKANNLGDMFQNRLGYIINKIIDQHAKNNNTHGKVKNRDKEASIIRENIVKAIQGITFQGEHGDDFKKLFAIDNDGKITDEFIEEEAKKALLTDPNFVNMFGRNGYFTQLLAGLRNNNNLPKGIDWDSVINTALTDTIMNPSANEYPYHDSIGDVSPNEREDKHRVKLGVKEQSAVIRLAGILAGAGTGSNTTKVDLSQANMSGLEAAQMLEQLLVDMRESQSNRVKNLIAESKVVAQQLGASINGIVEQTDSDLVIKYGQDFLSGTGIEKSAEDFARAISGWKKGGISQLDYDSTPMGIISKVLKEQGLDRAVLDLSDFDIRRDLDDGESIRLNNIIIPLIEATEFDDTYMLDEMNKATSDLFKAFNNKTGSKAEIANRLQNAVNKYLETARNIVVDKNGAYYNAQNTVTPKHSAAMKAIGINRSGAVNEAFQNVAMISEQQAKDMLKSSGLYGKDKAQNRKAQLQKLKAITDTVKGQLTQNQKDTVDNWKDEEHSFDDFKQLENELINAIVEAITFNGDYSKLQDNYLVEFFHRYPSIDGLDEVLAKVVVDKSLDNGTIKMGQGLTESIKGDYDGDKIRTWLGIGGDGVNGFNADTYKKTETAKRALEQIFDKTARMVAKGSNADNSDDLVFGSVGEKAKVDEMIETLKSKKFTGLMSKFNKENIGKLSNNASELRSLLYNANIDERGIVAGDAETLENAAYSALFRMIFEQIEQDAISSKKISARLVAHVNDVISKTGIEDNLENREKIIMDEISKLAELIQNRQLKEALDTSIALGIFDKDGLNTAKARSTLNFIANAFGNGDNDIGGKILRDVVGAKWNEAEGYYSGISLEGLYKIIDKVEKTTPTNLKFAPRNNNTARPTFNYGSKRYTEALDLMAQGSVLPTTQSGVALNNRFSSDLAEQLKYLKENTLKGNPIKEEYREYLAKQLSTMDEKDQIKMAFELFPEFSIKDEQKALEALNKLVGEEHVKAMKAATQAEQQKMQTAEGVADAVKDEESAIAHVNKQAEEEGKIPLTYLQYAAQMGNKAPDIEYAGISRQGNILKTFLGDKAVDLTPTSITGTLNPSVETQESLARRQFIKNMIANNQSYADLVASGADNPFKSEKEFEEARRNYAGNIAGSISHLFFEAINKANTDFVSDPNFNVQQVFSDFLKNNSSKQSEYNRLVNELKDYGYSTDDLHLMDNAESLADAMKQAGLKFIGVGEQAAGMEVTLNDGTKKLVGAIMDTVFFDEAKNELVVGDFKTGGKVSNEAIGQVNVESKMLAKALEALTKDINNVEVQWLRDSLVKAGVITKNNDGTFNTSSLKNLTVREGGMIAHVRDGQTTLYNAPKMTDSDVGHYIGYAALKKAGYGSDFIDESTKNILFKGGLSSLGAIKGTSTYGDSVAEMFDIVSSTRTDTQALNRYFSYQEKIIQAQAKIEAIKRRSPGSTKDKSTYIEIANLEKMIAEYEKLGGTMEYVVNTQKGTRSLLYRNTTTGLQTYLTDNGIESYLARQSVFDYNKENNVIDRIAKYTEEDIKSQVTLAKEYVSLEKDRLNIKEQIQKIEAEIVALEEKQKNDSLMESEKLVLQQLNQEKKDLTENDSTLRNRQKELYDRGFDAEKGTYKGKELSTQAQLVLLKQQRELQEANAQKLRDAVKADQKAAEEAEKAKQKEIENTRQKYTELYTHLSELQLQQQKNKYAIEEQVMVNSESDVGKAKLTKLAHEAENLSQEAEETRAQIDALTKSINQLDISADEVDFDGIKEEINKEYVPKITEIEDNHAIKRAEIEASNKKVQTKHVDQDITAWTNNYKKQLEIEREILKQKERLNNVVDGEKKNTQEYINLLERQRTELQAIAPKYDTQNKTMNGILMTEEQLIRIEQNRTKILNDHDAKLAKQTASYKQQIPLLDQLVGSLKNIFQNVSLYSMAQRGFNAIENSIRQVITSAKELDSAFVDIQIASGMNRKETNDFMYSLNRLGNELGMTTQEMASASNDWLRAGYEGKEAMELTRASASLAQLGMINTSDATSYLISSLKGWKLEAQDVMRVVDALTAVDMSAAISAGDLAESMSRANSSARLAGIELNRYIGYLTTVADITQRAPESVGEGFKTLFSRIGNVKLNKYTATLEEQQSGNYNEDEWENLSDVESSLDNIGIKLRANATTYRETQEVLDEIGEKWDTLDQVAKNSLVSALFGTRQRELGLTLFDNYDQVKVYEQIAKNSYGTAQEKMLAYTDSIEAAQKRYKNALEKFALVLDRLDIVKTFYNAITFLAENAIALGTAFTTMAFLLKGKEITSLFTEGFSSLAIRAMNFGDKLNNMSRDLGNGDFFKNAFTNMGAVINEVNESNLKQRYTSQLIKDTQGRLTSDQQANWINTQDAFIFNKDTNLNTAEEALTRAMDEYAKEFQDTQPMADLQNKIRNLTSSVSSYQEALKNSSDEMTSAEIQEIQNNLNRSQEELATSNTQLTQMRTQQKNKAVAAILMDERYSAIKNQLLAPYEREIMLKQADIERDIRAGIIQDDLSNARKLAEQAVLEEKISEDNLRNATEGLSRRRNEPSALGNILVGLGTTAGSILGAFGLGNFGKQFFGDTGQVFGSMFGGVLGNAFSGSLLKAVTSTTMIDGVKKLFSGGGMAGIISALGAPGVITAMIGLVSIGVLSFFGMAEENRKKKIEQQAKEFEEESNKYQEMLSASIDAGKFDKLAQGVDKLGRNVSLTDDEYQEFLDLNNKLAEKFPSLISHTDGQGQAFVSAAEGADTLSESINNLIEAQQRLADEKMLAPELFEQTYQDAKKEYDEVKNRLEVAKENSVFNLDNFERKDKRATYATDKHTGTTTFKSKNQEDYEKLKRFLEDREISYTQDGGTTYQERGETYYTPISAIKIELKEAKNIEKDLADFNTKYLGELASLETGLKASKQALNSEIDGIFRELNLQYKANDILDGFDSEAFSNISDDLYAFIRDAVSNIGYDAENGEEFKKQVAQYIKDIMSVATDEDMELILRYGYEYDDSITAQGFENGRQQLLNFLLNVAKSMHLKEDQYGVFLKPFGFTYVGIVNGEHSASDDMNYYERIVEEGLLSKVKKDKNGNDNLRVHYKPSEMRDVYNFLQNYNGRKLSQDSLFDIVIGQKYAKMSTKELLNAYNEIEDKEKEYTGNQGKRVNEIKKNMKEWADSLGLVVTETEDIADALNRMPELSPGGLFPDDFSYEDLEKIYANYKKVYDYVSKSDFTGKNWDNDILNAIASTPDMKKKILPLVTDGDKNAILSKLKEIMVEADAMQDQYWVTRLGETEEGYKKLLSINEDLVDEINEMFGIELDNYTTLKEAEEVITAQAAGNINNIWLNAFNALLPAYKQDLENFKNIQDAKVKMLAAVLKIAGMADEAAIDLADRVANQADNLHSIGISETITNSLQDGLDRVMDYYAGKATENSRKDGSNIDFKKLLQESVEAEKNIEALMNEGINKLASFSSGIDFDKYSGSDKGKGGSGKGSKDKDKDKEDEEEEEEFQEELLSALDALKLQSNLIDKEYEAMKKWDSVLQQAMGELYEGARSLANWQKNTIETGKTYESLNGHIYKEEIVTDKYGNSYRRLIDATARNQRANDPRDIFEIISEMQDQRYISHQADPETGILPWDHSYVPNPEWEFTAPALYRDQRKKLIEAYGFDQLDFQGATIGNVDIAARTTLTLTNLLLKQAIRGHDWQGKYNTNIDAYTKDENNQIRMYSRVWDVLKGYGYDNDDIVDDYLGSALPLFTQSLEKGVKIMGKEIVTTMTPIFQRPVAPPNTDENRNWFYEGETGAEYGIIMDDATGTHIMAKGQMEQYREFVIGKALQSMGVELVVPKDNADYINSVWGMNLTDEEIAERRKIAASHVNYDYTTNDGGTSRYEASLAVPKDPKFGYYAFDGSYRYDPNRTGENEGKWTWTDNDTGIEYTFNVNGSDMPEDVQEKFFTQLKAQMYRVDKENFQVLMASGMKDENGNYVDFTSEIYNLQHAYQLYENTDDNGNFLGYTTDTAYLYPLAQRLYWSGAKQPKTFDEVWEELSSTEGGDPLKMIALIDAVWAAINKVNLSNDKFTYAMNNITSNLGDNVTDICRYLEMLIDAYGEVGVALEDFYESDYYKKKEENLGLLYKATEAELKQLKTMNADAVAMEWDMPDNPDSTWNGGQKSAGGTYVNLKGERITQKEYYETVNQYEQDLMNYDKEFLNLDDEFVQDKMKTYELMQALRDVAHELDGVYSNFSDYLKHEDSFVEKERANLQLRYKTAQELVKTADTQDEALEYSKELAEIQKELNNLDYENAKHRQEILELVEASVEARIDAQKIIVKTAQSTRDAIEAQNKLNDLLQEERDLRMQIYQYQYENADRNNKYVSATAYDDLKFNEETGKWESAAISNFNLMYESLQRQRDTLNESMDATWKITYSELMQERKNGDMVVSVDGTWMTKEDAATLAGLQEKYRATDKKEEKEEFHRLADELRRDRYGYTTDNAGTKPSIKTINEDLWDATQSGETERWTSQEAYQKSFETEEYIKYATESMDIQEQMGDAIYNFVNMLVDNIERNIAKVELKKPDEWGNYKEIRTYGRELIQNLQYEYNLLFEALKHTEEMTDDQILDLTEKYQEIITKLEETRKQTLEDETDYQNNEFGALTDWIEEQMDKLRDLQDEVEDYYDDLLPNLEKELADRKRNNELLELENNLLNAREKTRVYRQGRLLCPV